MWLWWLLTVRPDEEARVEAAEVLKIEAKFGIQDYTKALPYKDPAELDKVVLALRKAGLPE